MSSYEIIVIPVYKFSLTYFMTKCNLEQSLYCPSGVLLAGQKNPSSVVFNFKALVKLKFLRTKTIRCYKVIWKVGIQHISCMIVCKSMIPEPFQRSFSSLQPHNNIIGEENRNYSNFHSLPVSHAYSADSGANIKKQRAMRELTNPIVHLPRGVITTVSNRPQVGGMNEQVGGYLARWKKQCWQRRP